MKKVYSLLCLIMMMGVVTAASESLYVWGDNGTYVGSKVNFFANYSNSSGYPINMTGVYCGFSVNDSGGWSSNINMSYNDSRFYVYNKTYLTAGEKYFNVTCNGSDGGYLTLSAMNRTVQLETTTTTTVTTSTVTTSTSTTVSTSTTTTTLPMRLVFTVPAQGAVVYVNQNRTTQVSFSARCGTIPCLGSVIYVMVQDMSLMTPSPFVCGNIAANKQCNATFNLNVTSAMGVPKHVWGRFDSTSGSNETGFYSVVATRYNSSVRNLMGVNLFDWNKNIYVRKYTGFDVAANVTCKSGACGNINVGLVGLTGGMQLIGQTPSTCNLMSQGMSCLVAFRLNATGNIGGVYKFVVNASNGADYAVSYERQLHVLEKIANATSQGSFNDTYVCNGTAVDIDGDGTHFYNSSFVWFSNNTPIFTGSSVLRCSVDAVCESKNNLFCLGCVTDDRGYDSICALSGAIYINYTPLGASPFITPYNPKFGNELICNENASDPEGRGLNFTYKWFMNDTESIYVSKTLGALATEANQNWTCQVVASDGVGVVKVNSSAVYIIGACPTTPELLIPNNDTFAVDYPLFMDWSNSTTTSGGVITYNLQISNDSDFIVNAINIDPIPSEYYVYTRIPETTYYWRARAYSYGCYSNWSRALMFVRANGTCADGIKNYHGGLMEESVDCGGPCAPCQCANMSLGSVTIFGQDNSTGLNREIVLSTTDNSEFERHCFDGCFGPEFGETDTDCGGFGVWACPQCGDKQDCMSDYDCQNGLYCHRGTGEGVQDKPGNCMSNVNLEVCRNGLYNPTVGESDVDCGGPCDRCGVGKMCAGTVDCTDGLLCNQFDKCVLPTEESQLKKGRQYGGIGTRGLGMNQAFCSGSSGLETKAEKPTGIGGYVGCAVFGNPFPNFEFPLLGSVVGTGYNTLQYSIDASGFSKLWRNTGLSNPRVVYHIDIWIDAYKVWVPFWTASDGQEYRCNTDQDCTVQGVWGGTTASSFNPVNLGICDPDPYIIPGLSNAPGVMDCRLECAGVGAANILENVIQDPLAAASWTGITDIIDCPNKCKHCRPFAGSVPFQGFDQGLINPYPIPQKSECMYVPLCASNKYRVSAQVFTVDAGGRQLPVPTENHIPFSACVAIFNTGADDKFTAKLECTPTTALPSATNSEFNDLKECKQPLLWDVSRCDGEAPLGMNVGSLAAGTTIDLFPTTDTFRRYYDRTGCSYADDVKTLKYIRTSCIVSPDEEELFSSILQKPLKEIPCADPKDVIIDFTDLYTQVLSSTSFAGGKYYRAWDDKVDPKKILMLITRKAAGNKECLVYDNLNSNAFKVWTDPSTYFDLYRGGESLQDQRYGPRIRMPLCSGDTYNVLVYFIENSLSFNTDRTYSSIADWQFHSAVQTAVPVISAPVVFTEILLPDTTRRFLEQYAPDGFRCSEIFNRDNGCAGDSFLDLMKSAGGVTLLAKNQFTVPNVGDTVNIGDITSVDSNTGEDLCYTDYYYTFKFDPDSLGVVEIDKNWYNISGAGNMKITDPGKLVDMFYRIFSPFDLSMPLGITIGTIMDALFSDGLWAALRMIVLVLVFYASKILIWVLMYGLISYMWIRMAARGHSIYILLLVIFLILLVLGKFGTYDNFIRMLLGR